ncbi:TetR family transcriptional regulator [Epidermidibacterium keratini]|uniref:TetR family transcriptional regulator n=1 Tax=Epidermidibacterium keratini TaxID=1891644 RepID=A0A7L4YSL8_9ACTN|nr:TetR/AcrR family transcriptional regulator [Epidermidibacterium keratini]QHC01779.1 TetR family transcriptional regulator [Epidermidibacterium keratini]
MVRLAIAERRELLLQAAWRVLVRDGVRAATTRAICSEAGMPQSSFHYCFDSRAELLRIIVTGLLPEQISTTFAALDVETDGENFAREPLAAFFAEVEQNPMRHAVLYDITMNAIYEPELADLATFQYDEYLRAAIEILTRAAERRGFTWDQPVEVLATTMLNFLDGLVLRYIVDRNSDRARAALEAYGDDLARHAVPHD